MDKDLLKTHRDFLKDNLRLTVDFSQTDQSRGVPPPPVEKPFPPDAARIDLPARSEWTTIGDIDITEAIARRESQRRFRPDVLTLEELAFLLWATQGIRQVVRPGVALRTVPSAGARHALETYLLVQNVDGLAPGIYRYLPVEHQLLLVSTPENLAEKIVTATLGQRFIAAAPVVFVWTTIPHRMEWRYSIAAHRVIAMDAGHVCQNLYLAVSAIGAGTCAVAAYHQQLMDELVGADGEEEYVIYMAPVGKI
jgi:SagB-type dehydrogenase family enzyme